MSAVLLKSFGQPPFDRKDILRYMGCKDADGEISKLLDSCLEEINDKLSYNVCYCELDVKITADECDFGLFRVTSSSLAQYLTGCKKAVVFAATVGVLLDRLISRYSKISPSRAFVINAIGTQQIEGLCDLFCESMEKGGSKKFRFSAGYGDLPLEAQKDIFNILGCSKKIGLTLNDSLVMSPSKSVTAFLRIDK